MIDIHCHYLPGIDDGAKTMEEALDLARASVKNGIRCAIMTPHLHPGRYENIKASIATATQEFRNALKKANIPLQIGYAAEVRLAPETLPLIESGQVPFLGEVEGYKLMLLEFPHSHIPLGADKLVDRLLDHKIRPIIAHPERNKDVMRDLDKIKPFVEMGCLLQLTAASIVNRFGDNAHTRAIELLESDAALVIATDAHNLKSRPPILREAMEAASKVIGQRAALDMVYRVPNAIVASQFTKVPQPERESGMKPDHENPNKIRFQRGRPGTPKTTQTPEIQNLDELRVNVEEGLKSDLAARMQKNLTAEYRDKLVSEIIHDAKQAAYHELKEQLKNELQQELLNKLQEQHQEQHSATQLVSEDIEIPRTKDTTQANDAPLASPVKNSPQKS